MTNSESDDGLGDPNVYSASVSSNTSKGEIEENSQILNIKTKKRAAKHIKSKKSKKKKKRKPSSSQEKPESNSDGVNLGHSPSAKVVDIYIDPAMSPTNDQKLRNTTRNSNKESLLQNNKFDQS